MTTDLVLVLALLGAAIAMFVVNRPRMDVVALLMIAALPFTGTVTMQEAIAGFADPNIVLIAVLFVLGEGLVRTGVARRLGDWIDSRSGGSEPKLIVLLLVSVAGLSALMSSTAVVAIFIPVVLRICRNTSTAPSKLLMPLSFAALIGGMMTLVATPPNLVVNAELVRQGEAGFGFFTITPIGLVVLALGIGYMLVARRWLPDGQGGDAAGQRKRPTVGHWTERYGLAGREFSVRLQPGSRLVGRRLEEVSLRDRGVNLLAIERSSGGRRPALVRPSRNTQLLPGDVLLLDVHASAEEIAALAEEYGFERLAPAGGGGLLEGKSQELGMTEAVVTAESGLIGKTVFETRSQSGYGPTVVGLRRGRKVITEALLDTRLELGDTLLLAGFWPDLQQLQQGNDDLVVLNMPAELEERLPAHDKAPQALAVLALVIVLMVSGVVPNVHAVLLGCLLLGLFGCVDMASAFRSINWQSLVLIVGMMPFSIALQRTGGVDLAAEALLGVVGYGSPRFALAAIFVITAVLGSFISNTATAILMAPVALRMAEDLGASPYPFAMIVALGASTAFMTPVSSPVNTLVVGPGNYRFVDFVKIGLPFSIVTAVVCVLIVPVWLPY